MESSSIQMVSSSTSLNPALNTSVSPNAAVRSTAVRSEEAHDQAGATSAREGVRRPYSIALSPLPSDADFSQKLDQQALEAVVEYKISRFLDQIGSFYPDNLHDLIIQKVEKPLLHQVLRRVGGNQVHASKILGINRNTLRKKMKMYGL